MPRVAIKYRTASKDNYEKFCLEYPDVNLTFKQWKEIIYKFSDNMTKHVLETGEKIKLPYGLGELSINKKKPNRTKTFQGTEYINLPIDWKKTREQGKYVYHMNYHSDGYRFSWIWFKDNCRFYQHELWWFKPGREMSRSINIYLTKSDQYSQMYNQWKLKI